MYEFFTVAAPRNGKRPGFEKSQDSRIFYEEKEAYEFACGRADLLDCQMGVWRWIASAPIVIRHHEEVEDDMLVIICQPRGHKNNPVIKPANLMRRSSDCCLYK